MKQLLLLSVVIAGSFACGPREAGHTPPPLPPHMDAAPPQASAQSCPQVSLARPVLYKGIDNTIRIIPADAAPGITNGTLQNGTSPGEYTVRVTEGTECIIAAATADASCKTNTTFAIKRLPDPVAFVGTVKGNGQMTRAELNATSGVFARMEDADLNIRFSIVSFVMVMNRNGVYVEKKANGPAITPDMKSLLAGARPGDRILFEDVTVKGPDEALRKITGVTIKVK